MKNYVHILTAILNNMIVLNNRIMFKYAVISNRLLLQNLKNAVENKIISCIDFYLYINDNRDCYLYRNIDTQ